MRPDPATLVPSCFIQDFRSRGRHVRRNCHEHRRRTRQLLRTRVPCTFSLSRSRVRNALLVHIPLRLSHAHPHQVGTDRASADSRSERARPASDSATRISTAPSPCSVRQRVIRSDSLRTAVASRELCSVIGAVESIATHGLGLNESVRPRHCHGRRIGRAVDAATCPIMFVGFGLKPPGFVRSPMRSMVLSQTTISVEEIDVSLRCQLRVSPDACNPDEHLRGQQVH
jgi:hypothetical protein